MDTDKSKQHNDQFVIAYLHCLQQAEQTIKWAVHFANLLDKGLILLHISDKQYTQVSPDEAEKELKTLNNQITAVKTHSYIALKGKTKEIIHSLGEALSAVLIVTSVNNEQQSNSHTLNSPKQVIKNFSTSRIAYFVFGSQATIKPFDNIVLPLNMLREAKEKVLWASYFGRFAQSQITIFHKQYKDEFHQQQLNYNLKFASNMLTKFNINFNLIDCPKNSKSDLDVAALEYAEGSNCNLVICQTTKNKSFIDFFSPLSELQALKHSQHIPILFLNPREDLFVLCE
ncbi:MAG: hypothetical protein LBO06_02180 [Bacteroidales bacterium]|jgi:nucleotide-binding universal stress UspA family protein|nr:hypothetical protein [Bacteroidales bacterium]